MRIVASCLFAALVTLAYALPGRAGVVPVPGAVFISPAEGSQVKEGKVTVIGRLTKGAGKAVFTLNGAPLAGVRKQNGYFSAVIAPSAGRNAVEAREGSVIGYVTFYYGPKNDGRPFYNFHPPLLDDQCEDCHPGPGEKKPQFEADICYGCHDSYLKRPFLHGPVGAGQCLFCHDPHGSVHPSLSREKPSVRCLICHDQKSSREHIGNSKNRDCIACHDPHAGKDQNLLKK